MTTEDPATPTLPSSDGRVRVLTRGSTAEDRFTAFAESSIAGLSRIAVMLCGDEHRANDLVQLALERTYRAWDRVGDGEPYAYARRVIATARIDSWRRTRRDVMTDPQQLRGASAPDPTESLLHRDELVRALRTLPPAQRRVIVLRYLLDQTEAQTAAELGISVGSVKSATSRGLARLRGVLDSAHEAPAPVLVSEDGRAMARRAVQHEKRRRVALAAGAAALATVLLVMGHWAAGGPLQSAPIPPAGPTSVLDAPSGVWDDLPLYQPVSTPPESWTEETVGRLRLAVPPGWTNDSADQAAGRGSWVDGPTQDPYDRAELTVYRQAERYPWDKGDELNVSRADVAGAASVLVVREDMIDHGELVHSSVIEVVLDGGGVYILKYTAPDDGAQEQLVGTILGSLAVLPS
ncbi:SigE family RNA polymerase sigma factor [Isoptericola croceus]|uniref:SigE family RNA polymerase sigma factor n=1 Tax=Isoptericola croceus TaxID=3031406 RepID=UPI0023F686D4|nr:SigE family RNA polymerase sigma factor [Isoptericola croceus]